MMMATVYLFQCSLKNHFNLNKTSNMVSKPSLYPLVISTVASFNGKLYSYPSKIYPLFKIFELNKLYIIIPPLSFNAQKITQKGIYLLIKVHALKKDTGVSCIFPYELCAFKQQIKRNMQDMDYKI